MAKIFEHFPESRSLSEALETAIFSDEAAPSAAEAALPVHAPADAAEAPIAAVSPDLESIAALLAKQIDGCHRAIDHCFTISRDSDTYFLENRFDALKIATRLIQASASAAGAIKRIKGSEFHQHVTVSSAS